MPDGEIVVCSSNNDHTDGIIAPPVGQVPIDLDGTFSLPLPPQVQDKMNNEPLQELKAKQ